MVKTDQQYKPFVKRVGGKRQLLEKFQEYYPESFSEYYEPFVGGGAVFFDLRNKYGNKFKAHLFDINEELVLTYNVIKEDTEGLIKLLSQFQKKHSKEFFLKVRAWDREKNFNKKYSDVERVARFLYLNRTAFNGLYRVNGEGYYNVPMGKYVNPKICDEELLYTAQEALKNTTIKKLDFEKSVKDAKAGDFVYFDPPYDPINKTSNFTDYTKGGFGDDDQIRLAKCFKDLSDRGCYVMASNNNTKFIKEIYKPYKTKLVSAKRMINSDATKRGAIKEIVIFSDTLKK